MNAPVQYPHARDDQRTIGAMLIDAGKITPECAEQVMRHARETGQRFGDAAVQLEVVRQEDIDQVLSRQFDFPYLAEADQSLSRELVAAYSPQSPVTEGVRALRTQLMLRWFSAEPPRKALAVVSAERGDGRSWLTGNLAVSFAQLGERTLVIDADMRQPRMHQLFNCENRSGLSATLSGRGAAAIVQPVARLPRLSVLSAGAVPPNSQELLTRPAFGELLEACARDYDVILIDTPPAADFADAQLAAARAGGALVVARKNVSRASRLTAMTQALGQSGCAMVGSVLNEY